MWAIASCKVRGCGCRVRVPADDLDVLNAAKLYAGLGWDMSSWEDPWNPGMAGRVRAAGLVCPTHDWALVAAPVRGTRSGKRCDGSCTHAVGPRCVCSCAGENHGADWTWAA